MIYVSTVFIAISLQQGQVIPGPKLDPPPVKLACSGANTVSFEAIATFDPFRLPGSSATAHPYKVWFKRPRKLRVERPPIVERLPTGPTSFEASGSNRDLFISDGTDDIHVATKENVYEKAPSPKELFRVKGDFEMQFDLLLQSGLWGYKREGSATVNGRMVDLYSVQSPTPNGKAVDREAVYVEVKTKLPVRYERMELVTGRKPDVLMRTDFNQWKINPMLGDSLFKFNPPPGAKRVDYGRKPGSGPGKAP